MHDVQRENELQGLMIIGEILFCEMKIYFVFCIYIYIYIYIFFFFEAAADCGSLNCF